MDLLNVLVQLLVLVCWQGLLEVGDPGFYGGHACRGLLSTLFDDVVWFFKQLFVLLLLVVRWVRRRLGRGSSGALRGGSPGGNA